MVKSAASSIYHSINMQQSYHDHHMDDSMQEKKIEKLSDFLTSLILDLNQEKKIREQQTFFFGYIQNF